MEKMLIIDDDAQVAQELLQTLEAHGWSVERADNGSDGLQLMRCSSYDFILLDWNMPGMSGLQLCKTFRAEGGETPIIFLTGRSETDDKIAGMEAGGDDYLAKPFEIRELLARVRAIQRRPRTLIRERLKVKDLELEPKLRSATKDGVNVQLSFTESNILELFLRKRNTFFTAAQVFASVWPSDSGASVETVRVHMQFLRAKLARIGAQDLIETVKGAGYIVRE
jgi:two-component system, OmpR family, manganese sensing response regulator